MENTQVTRKKNKLVIVGTGETAAIATEMATCQTDYEICGYSVEAESMKDNRHMGLPVVPLDQIATFFPSSDFCIFVAISFVWLNQPRSRIFTLLQKLDYEFANLISPHAHIAPSATLGTNLMIYDFASVGSFCTIANNTTLCSHSVVSHSSQIGAHSYLAASAVTGGYCRTGERCFIGLNATLADHSEIDDDSIVSATSYLPKGSHASGLYAGNPARRQDIAMADFLRLKRGIL